MHIIVSNHQFGVSWHHLTPVAWVVSLLMAGCGGSDSTTTTNSLTPNSLVEANTFPSGLSVGVPSELNNSTTVAQAPWNGWRFATDWTRSIGKAFNSNDTATLGALLAAAMPMGVTRAAPAQPDLKAQALVIEKVLSGDSSVSLDDILDLDKLFTNSVNATCYGPNMEYANHQDAGGGLASGTLPTGDLGLWKENEGSSTTPCIVAQLNARVAGVKSRTKQGLMMMALMRRVVAVNSLALPTQGNTVDIKASMQTRFNLIGALSGVTVEAASIALNTDSTIYTYRLVVSSGSGESAKTGEIILKHTPGASAAQYSGVMQVAGFYLSNDAAFGCSDQVDGSNFKVAQVSTLKYSRSGTTVAFGSRDGSFCGDAPSASSNLGAEVATFTSDGQLDPSVAISGGGGGTPARGDTLGWRGNFTRFAGDYDKDTVDGNFLYAWQAGTGDSHSRALAARANYNSATELRTVEGYFAFADAIASTNGSLLGMICNWAGPGNSHSPTALFQSQKATLTASASDYAIATSSDSKITYAPTNSCSSSTTEFDADANNTLDSGEGAGTVSSLDEPTGLNDVQQEIVSRGFSIPTLF